MEGAPDIYAHRGKFFEVLAQTERTLTAVMTVAPGETAGPEEEHGGDQILFIIEGRARVRLGDDTLELDGGALVTVPAGTRHHVTSVGREPLFLVTIYAPPAY